MYNNPVHNINLSDCSIKAQILSLVVIILKLFHNLQLNVSGSCRKFVSHRSSFYSQTSQCIALNLQFNLQVITR